MNTSRRRTPVTAWAITAAALYGVVGVGTAALAAADDSRAGTDPDTAANSASSNDSGPRRHGRPDGPAAPSAAGDTWHPGDPCPWWPTPKPIAPPAPHDRTNANSSGLIAFLTPTPPVPVFAGEVESVDELPALPALPADAPAQGAPAPVAPAPVYAQASALPAPVPRSVAVLVAPPPPAAAPPQSAPLQIAPAGISPPAPPPQRPAAGVEAPPPVRLGYPDQLRNADLSTLASMALPGLAAMAGMTALGGLLGYRQARAGYLLRAAGAGRFLR